ncbi:MAG: zinc-ribbon domain-containing protein [Geminicoccaceae bacterium]
MALEPCPNCSKKISPSAGSCPHCGHPLSDKVWNEARRVRRNRGIIGTVLVVLLVGWCSIYSASNDRSVEDSSSRAERECEDDVVAFVGTQEFVRESLKSPSTADFPSIVDDDVSVTYLGNCAHQIVAYVDAENAFGGTIRTYYTAIMEYRRSSDAWYHWTLGLSFADTRAEIAANAQVNRTAYEATQSKAQMPSRSARDRSDSVSSDHVR